MPTVHILAADVIHHLPVARERTAAEDAKTATPVTMCGRRDIPRICIGDDLKQAQEMASESLWSVCPGCIASFAALVCLNP